MLRSYDVYSELSTTADDEHPIYLLISTSEGNLRLFYRKIRYISCKLTED